MGNKKRVLHRLKIARGHLDKIIEMVEKDSYCIDVVHQSLAVQAALKKTDNVILNNHMRTCMAESIQRGNGKMVIDEMVKVLQKNV